MRAWARPEARSSGDRQPACTRETKQCDYTTWGPTHERPACCTEHLLELLTFTHEVLDVHGIVHWLDFGTLLGAVREGQLIPWDDDCDLAAFDSDADRILALRDVIEAAGYRLEVTNPANIRIHYSSVNENHVDLWLYRVRDGLLVSDENPFWLWPGMHDRHAFPSAYVDELEEVILHGKPFPAPSPVHDFLREHRYGPNYMIPQRPIMTRRIRPVIESSEMTPAADELLIRIAERDAYLVTLTNSHSRLLRAGSWTPHDTRWLIASGLPIETDQRHVEAARMHISPEDRSPAVEKLVQTLAWIEGAIDECEHPPRLIALRRAHRRYRRMSAAAARRLSDLLRRPRRGTR
jgi:hypothetical protein